MLTLLRSVVTSGGWDFSSRAQRLPRSQAARSRAAGEARAISAEGSVRKEGAGDPLLKSQETATTYVYKLKATKQRVSVALRRSTSRAIMEMQRRAKAYPVVAVDAAA